MTTSVPHTARTADTVPGWGGAAGMAADPWVQATVPAPLLVAYTSAYLAAGVLRVAELLARRDGVNAHVAAVLPRVHTHASVLTPEDAEALRVGRLLLWRKHLRRQLHRAVGRPAWFSTSTHEGTSERTFAAVARERGAGCVLVGLDDPGAPGRTASEQMLLHLVRLAAVPVLGVPRGATSVPARALAAMDGSPGGARAARAAARLLPRGGSLTLAHVAAVAERGADAERERLRGDGADGRCLEPLAAELRSRGGLQVEIIHLEGNPAAAVPAVVERQGVELLACGTPDWTSAGWYPMTGTGITLLRATSCAVLLA